MHGQNNKYDFKKIRYFIDPITAIKNSMFTVAYGTAMPTQPGDVYNGQQIPPGYTRVAVEQVCQGWETLELDIPRGDGERTLAEAIYGYILWDKRYIILKSDDRTRPASQHASPRPSSPQNPPRAALSQQGSPAHSPSPSSHAPKNTQASPSPPWSPPPPPAKKQKQPPAQKVIAPAKEPPKKKEKKKKTKCRVPQLGTP